VIASRPLDGRQLSVIPGVLGDMTQALPGPCPPLKCPGLKRLVLVAKRLLRYSGGVRETSDVRGVTQGDAYAHQTRSPFHGIEQPPP